MCALQPLGHYGKSISICTSCLFTSGCWIFHDFTGDVLLSMHFLKLSHLHFPPHPLGYTIHSILCHYLIPSLLTLLLSTDSSCLNLIMGWGYASLSYDASAGCAWQWQACFGPLPVGNNQGIFAAINDAHLGLTAGMLSTWAVSCKWQNSTEDTCMSETVLTTGGRKSFAGRIPRMQQGRCGLCVHTVF